MGRFDLERRTFLPPLEVAGPLSNNGGVWDVLAHPNGRIYFTTYFGPAGSVDPASGSVERFPDPGTGLNELELGPDDSILASRYSTPDGLPGAVVQLDQEGRLLAEHVLEPTAGYRTAAKSLAWDPAREEIWVNTDLLPESGGGAIGHDARVLGADGRERLRVADPELQFMTFGPDGTGYFAERHGRRLRLRIRGPELDDDPLLPARIVALDDAFPEVDFVQDIRVGDDGSALVMRWSGRLHRVHANGRLQDLSLPRLAPDGLYYTAVQHAGRVCATYCADVSVVCRPLR